MVDTPSKPFPALKTRGPAFARIDPDGNVTATWRTWGILALGVVWLTMTYVKLDDAAQRVNALTIEVQVHREVLIQAGLLKLTTVRTNQ